MTQIVLTMRGVPASRPRVTKNGTFNPAKYSNYKKALSLYFNAFRCSYAPQPLEIDVLFVFKPSKSVKSNKFPDSPPYDVDNLLKGILDAGNGVLYDDDLQINKASVTKKYGAEDKIYITLKNMVL